MEVYIEAVRGGGRVTGRIVLQGKRSTEEIARLSLTPAHWEDFIDCLRGAARSERGRIVFAPAPKRTADPLERIGATLTTYHEEAVA